MADRITKSVYEPYLNSKFEIIDDEIGCIEVELVEVVEKKSEKVDCVSLLFRGPKEPVLRHETHRVKHPKMGERKIFLGPVVHEKQDGVYYEAIFTYLNE